MKLWLDDIRSMPADYTHHAYSVEAAIMMIMNAERIGEGVEVLDLDHDLGEYAQYGGDGIALLDWLIQRETFYPIKLHTANPVGKNNMLKLIERFWKEQEPIIPKELRNYSRDELIMAAETLDEYGEYTELDFVGYSVKELMRFASLTTK